MTAKTVQSFALIAGIVYLVVGVAGFFDAFVTAPRAMDPTMGVQAGYGRLFGLFPINVLHNLVHLAIGVWGVVAYNSFSSSRTFSKGLAIIYGILAVMGLFPGLKTTFGLIPLFGHDVWLHAVTAVAAAYFGWVTVTEERRRPVTA